MLSLKVEERAGEIRWLQIHDVSCIAPLPSVGGGAPGTNHAPTLRDRVAKANLVVLAIQPMRSSYCYGGAGRCF